MAGQRRHPAGLLRYEGNPVPRADQKPGAVECPVIARLHKHGQVTERHGHGAQVQRLRAGGHLFQAATVLKAVDRVAIVQRGQANVVARLAAWLAVGADDVAARGGKGHAVHAFVGLQVHGRFCGGAAARGNRGRVSNREAQHARILPRVAVGGP